MSQLVTISSVTANTPVNIYYCDSTGSSCVYVETVSVFPYTFNVPDPYDLSDYRIKQNPHKVLKSVFNVETFLNSDEDYFIYNTNRN